MEGKGTDGGFRPLGIMREGLPVGVPLLDIKGLGVRFGGLQALQSFNLSVPQGGLVGLIGPNGAGKTTVFNLITGVYRPTSGTIALGGKPIVGLQAHRISRAGIARTFQNIRLFSGLSVRDNLIAACTSERKNTLLASLLGLPGTRATEKALGERAEALLAFVELDRLKDALATSLPYGLQRKLEIARALMTRPHLLLLDEPAAGMNPTEKDNLAQLVGKIAGQGIGVLLIEHDMKFVMNLCAEITVLDHGEIIAVGTPSHVQTHPAVIEAYLGVAEPGLGDGTEQADASDASDGSGKSDPHGPVSGERT